MSPAHAEVLLRLRAVDQGVPRFGGFGDLGARGSTSADTSTDPSFASGLESGGTQHASCMLSFVEAHGTYEYVCDRHEVVDGAAAAQPKKVTLRPKRIAVEHGFVCAVRKRGKFNASVFEGNFGARPAVVVSRCMTESLLGKKDKECLAEAGADESGAHAMARGFIMKRPRNPSTRAHHCNAGTSTRTSLPFGGGGGSVREVGAGTGTEAEQKPKRP